jgi:hypothetical protein
MSLPVRERTVAKEKVKGTVAQEENGVTQQAVTHSTHHGLDASVHAATWLHPSTLFSVLCSAFRCHRHSRIKTEARKQRVTKVETETWTKRKS